MRCEHGHEWSMDKDLKGDGCDLFSIPELASNINPFTCNFFQNLFGPEILFLNQFY
jgi:hypothetical protein